MSSRVRTRAKARRRRPTANEAFRAGIAAGLSAADALRERALKQAEAQLVAFKSKDREFYRQVKDKVAGIFDSWASETHDQVRALSLRATAEAIRRDVPADEAAVLRRAERSRPREPGAKK